MSTKETKFWRLGYTEDWRFHNMTCYSRRWSDILFVFVVILRPAGTHPLHWQRNENVIWIKFSLLTAPKIAIMTTFGAASDENIVKFNSFLQCICSNAKGVITYLISPSFSIIVLADDCLDLRWRKLLNSAWDASSGIHAISLEVILKSWHGNLFPITGPSVSLGGICRSSVFSPESGALTFLCS